MSKFLFKIKTVFILGTLISFVFVPSKVFAEENSFTIKAYSIVCPTEDLLPDWGFSNEVTNISETTASNFLLNNPECSYEQNWNFQWGYNSTQDESKVGVHKLNGSFVGEANGEISNCYFQCGENTNTGTGYNDWNNFATSTGLNGEPAVANISKLQNSVGIWIREVLKPNYLSFAYPPISGEDSTYSAEIYCNYDVNKFDNYDQVYDPKFGNTYYCVAFNVLLEEPEPTPTPISDDIEEDEDGDKDGSDDDEDEDNEEDSEEEDEDKKEVLGSSKYQGGTVRFITYTPQEQDDSTVSEEVEKEEVEETVIPVEEDIGDVQGTMDCTQPWWWYLVAFGQVILLSALYGLSRRFRLIASILSIFTSLIAIYVLYNFFCVWWYPFAALFLGLLFLAPTLHRSE